MTDTPDQTGSQTPSSGAESSPPAAPAPAKADLGKRAIAMIIDAVATMIVGFVPLIGGGDRHRLLVAQGRDGRGVHGSSLAWQEAHEAETGDVGWLARRYGHVGKA